MSVAMLKTDMTQSIHNLPAIALSPDTDTRTILVQYFKQNSWSIDGVINANQEQAIELLSQSSTPPVLIVDVDRSIDPVRFLNDIAAECDSNTQVIVLGCDNRIKTYHEIKSLGVKDYLPKPIDLLQLEESFSTPTDNSSEQQSPKLKALSIAVMGTRGGVGATAIALEIARSTLPKKTPKKSKKIKTSEIARETILLDLDMCFGSSALYLDVQPSHALVDAISSPERIDDLFLERSSIQLENGMHLMAAEDDPSQVTEIGDDAIITLHEKLSTTYKNVVADIPRHLSSHLTELSSHLDHLVLVLEPNIASLRDAIRINNWVETIEKSPTIHIVINKIGQSKTAELSLKDITQTLGKEPIAQLPHLPECFSIATEKGQSVQDCKPPKQLKIELDKLRDAIFEIPESAPKSSLVSKLLGKRS